MVELNTEQFEAAEVAGSRGNGKRGGRTRKATDGGEG